MYWMRQYLLDSLVGSGYIHKETRKIGEPCLCGPKWYNEDCCCLLQNQLLEESANRTKEWENVTVKELCPIHRESIHMHVDLASRKHNLGASLMVDCSCK